MSTLTATEMLEATIESVRGVVPYEVFVKEHSIIPAPFTQNSIGVLIGMTGDIRGRVIIDGNEKVFGKLGEGMFGMALEGDMLESFAGELGNMIAGNLSTFVSKRGVDMDITPPTVLVGTTKMYGFDKALSIPINISDFGVLTIILMVEL